MQRDEGALEPDTILRGAAEVGVALTAGQAVRLARFAHLLIKWNRVYNLTARAAPADVLTLHLLDSLAAGPAVEQLASEIGHRVLDVGAGGGFPGIPLAIAYPDLDVTLLDAVEKKTAFLAQAKLELSLGNTTVVHARVEDHRAPQFDLVVSRAFSSLADLVQLTSRHVQQKGAWLALKGAYPADEIAALAATPVEVASTVKLRVPSLDAERHLVTLRFRPPHARHL